MNSLNSCFKKIQMLESSLEESKKKLLKHIHNSQTNTIITKRKTISLLTMMKTTNLPQMILDNHPKVDQKKCKNKRKFKKSKNNLKKLLKRKKFNPKSKNKR